VRPENQQTNQINHFDQDQFNYVTTKPDSGFITYIGSITTRPLSLDIKPSTESNKVFHRPSTVRRKPTSTTLRPITTRKPEVVTKRPTYHNASHYNHAFGVKTRQPIPVFIATTTPKPFVRDVIASRPKVTSLPIDRPTLSPEIINPFGSQTEKTVQNSETNVDQ
jgi:hypothetical protein